MSILEQVLEFLDVLIDRTMSGDINWERDRCNASNFKFDYVEIEMLPSRNDIILYINSIKVCFLSSEYPALKDKLERLYSEVSVENRFSKNKEELMMELSKIILKI